jgi:hypothetical protein
MAYKATDLSTDLWGGILHSDNRGFYTSLEFFALAAGLSEDDFYHPERWDNLADLSFSIPGHILARRFAFDPDEGPDVEIASRIDEDLVEVVRAVIRELKVEIPGAGKAGQSWSGSHFVPYGANLTHWDARIRSNRARIERIYFRGTGTLALAILLKDGDRDRARRSMEILRDLLGREHFTGHLLGLLHDLEAPEHGIVQFSSAMAGDSPHLASLDTGLLERATVKQDRWDELLQECVHNILVNDSAPGVVRLDAIYHMVPLITSLMQLGRSSVFLARDELDLGIQKDPYPIVVDCSPPDSRTNEVRQAAHRSFSSAQQTIIESFRRLAKDLEVNLSSTQIKQFRSYFTRGAPAIGLLNAATGIRRFVLGAGLLESLVLAVGEKEITFEHFVEHWLHERFGMIVDARAARKHGLDRQADLSVFDDNARHLSETLNELGLMQSYSDATRMVRYGF